jgi:putative N6-adenine-specific DNA methylase
MSIFTTTSKITLTCHKWLSPYLEQEVRALGYVPTRVFATGVELQGTGTDCMVLNLHLRCASQVLYSLKAFECNSADELYNTLVKLDWLKYITTDTFFTISSNVYHESMNTNLYANLRVKDAIADSMRLADGKRANSGAGKMGAVFHLHWKHEQAEIFIETSGDSLAKHGYRKQPGLAPMLEALATATIMASEWQANTSFVNPMCGAGTLAIEAALMASNIPPSVFRNNYAFMHINGYSNELIEPLRKKIEEGIIQNPNVTIIASDYSKRALGIAQANAAYANVDHLIEFVHCDFAKTPLPFEQKGIVMLNPEYGERLGDIEELTPVYKRIGDFLKQQCAGYTGYIFTGNLELAKHIGLKAERRIEFVNGKIECRLLKYTIYEGSKRTPKAE